VPWAHALAEHSLGSCRAYESAGADAKHSIAATFTGLNLYLGSYIGEFLGEVCLGLFFLLSGLALCAQPMYPAWLGIAGSAFGVVFIVGAWRNVFPRVQPLADLNNYLLPLWMIVLGVAIIAFDKPVGGAVMPPRRRSGAAGSRRLSHDAPSLTHRLPRLLVMAPCRCIHPYAYKQSVAAVKGHVPKRPCFSCNRKLDLPVPRAQSEPQSRLDVDDGGPQPCRHFLPT
jgi:hypothetical protein